MRRRMGSPPFLPTVTWYCGLIPKDLDEENIKLFRLMVLLVEVLVFFSPRFSLYTP
jgi:hypothetical protein